jgi:3-hexulose-6-phosphate synthase
MKLQYAFDTCTYNEYFQILDQVGSMIDIIEVGTPTALRYGIEIIKQTKIKYPDSIVVADFKICDGGEYEADMAFDSGADIVTVMGFSNDETIKGVVRSAKRHGKQCTVDMMRISDIEARAKTVVAFGADYVCVHNATDALDFNSSFEYIKRAAAEVSSSRLAIAGGINPDNISKLRIFDPAIIIIGNSISTAADKAQMISQLKTLYNG